MARVYLETSFVSACVTDRSDAGSVYRREASLRWWRDQAPSHALCISPEVVLEISSPGFRQSRLARGLIEHIASLDIDEEVMAIAALFIREKAVPGPLRGDALHLALATVRRVDYMLSWNVKHLANPNKRAHLAAVCRRLGLDAPTIVTPDAF